MGPVWIGALSLVGKGGGVHPHQSSVLSRGGIQSCSFSREGVRLVVGNYLGVVGEAEGIASGSWVVSLVVVEWDEVAFLEVTGWAEREVRSMT